MCARNKQLNPDDKEHNEKNVKQRLSFSICYAKNEERPDEAAGVLKKCRKLSRTRRCPDTSAKRLINLTGARKTCFWLDSRESHRSSKWLLIKNHWLNGNVGLTVNAFSSYAYVALKQSTTIRWLSFLMKFVRRSSILKVWRPCSLLSVRRTQRIYREGFGYLQKNQPRPDSLNICIIYLTNDTVK